MRTILALAAISLAATAALAAQSPRLSPTAKRGLAIAEARCATCHAVGRDAEQSPNPAAPPFELIANKPGVTRATLNTFLRDAHNYPEVMRFKLGRRDTDRLAAYMMTLRRKDYHPPI